MDRSIRRDHRHHSGPTWLRNATNDCHHLRSISIGVLRRLSLDQLPCELGTLVIQIVIWFIAP